MKGDERMSWIFLSKQGRIVTTNFKGGTTQALYEIEDEKLRALFINAGDARMDDLDFLTRLERIMDKGSRAAWLYVWIDRKTGAVMRTKRYPDGTKGQHHEDYYAQFVPPFIHESSDAVVEKFLRVKGKVGPKNGGPKTEQEVKWHDEKRRVTKSLDRAVNQAVKHELAEEIVKRKPQGQKTLFDIDALFVDINSLFDDEDGASDIDSLFD
jgi:hypothetical protein